MEKSFSLNELESLQLFMSFDKTIMQGNLFILYLNFENVFINRMITNIRQINLD